MFCRAHKAVNLHFQKVDSGQGKTSLSTSLADNAATLRATVD